MEIRRHLIFWFCLLAAHPGHMAAQSFLQLQGITGSSTDTNHVGWMELERVTLAGVSENLAGVNRTPAVSTFGDLCFAKPLDSASPALALNCAERSLISSGTVDIMQPAALEARYFRLNFTNIFITSVGQTGSGAVDENVCLSPQIISWNYTHYRTNSGLADAYISGQWDAFNNRGVKDSTPAAFTAAGIRNSAGVQLNWNAAAGQLYRIYSVTALNQPFVPVALVTAPATGSFSYTFVPVAPAMFYTVEAVPAGF
jgi:type VI protein secretion system component Hcp